MIYTIIKLVRKEEKIKELITLPTIIYCVLIFFVYYIVKDVRFTDYDEFMFWGTNLKEMLHNSCLWANSKIDGIHLIYPPYTAIIEYIFCKFNGGFNEGAVYLGMITLMLTSLMPLLKEEKYSIKSLVKIILTIVITFFSIVLCVYSIKNLAVDCILGILFSVSMFLAYKLQKKKDYIVLVILLISLTLIKTNGILLSGIVIMQIFVMKVLCLIKEKEKSIKNIVKKLTIIGILLITIITSYGTWKIYYTANGKQIDDRHDKNYVENINIKEFINALTLSEEASERNKKIVLDFANAMLHTEMIRTKWCNSTVWVVVIIDIGFLIYMIGTSNKLRKIANFISINIGLLLYLLSNLIVFMFVFQPYQGEILMGIERYVLTYILAMILNLVFFMIEEINRKKVIVIFSLMMLIALTSFRNVIIDPRKISELYDIDFEMVMAKAKQIIEGVKENEKVYIIDQKLDNGKEFQMIRCYITPIKTNLLYEWNIGSNDAGVYYKMPITEKDFIEKLIEEHYDYVYVVTVKPSFLEEYKNIFSEEAKQELQKIVMNEEEELEPEDLPEKRILLKVNKETKMIE